MIILKPTAILDHDANVFSWTSISVLNESLILISGHRRWIGEVLYKMSENVYYLKIWLDKERKRRSIGEVLYEMSENVYYVKLRLDKERKKANSSDICSIQVSLSHEIGNQKESLEIIRPYSVILFRRLEPSRKNL